MDTAPDIYTLRTLVMSAITAGVGAGLTLNRLRNRDIQPTSALAIAPHVAIIIPARNEERNIGSLLSTLAALKYPQDRLKIIVVDDVSTDATARIAATHAEAMSTLELVPAASDLPPGWTGKNHAMWTGAQHSSDSVDWLLFVDADTRHHPLMLQSVLSEAERRGADLLSLVLDVKMRTFWERLIVPQVGELYTLLVGSMDRVNAGGRAAANGQFMLVRREVYLRLGTLPQVTSDVAEDRAFAAVCAAEGYKVQLAYGRRLVSARVYSSLREMWTGYTKTLYWATGGNTLRSLSVAGALAFYAFAPLITLAQGAATNHYLMKRRLMKHGLIQLVPQLLLRAAVCRQVRVHLALAAVYPLSVAVTNSMLLYSMYRVKSGKGVRWKGRVYTRLS